MRAVSISVYSMKKTPFCLRCSICCPPVGMGFLLWVSAIIGFLSPACMGYSTSVFSRYCEDRSSVHGATACNYSLISTRVNSLTCGLQTARKPPALIHLRLRLAACALKGGRVSKRAFSALSSLQRLPIAPFGTETKTQPPEFEMSF